MRIVQISQQDEGSGGFKAALRLHRSLIQAGQDSRLVVLSKTTNTSGVMGLVRPNLLAKITWRLLGMLNNWELRRYSQKPRCGWTASDYSIGALRTIRRMKPDVVQLHLFDCVLTYEDVARIPAPVFWTFHDMGAITGGCHCTPDCLRYKTGCGCCPELGSTEENDASRRGWDTKRKAWSHTCMTGIAPSRWLEREALDSPMCSGHPIVRIPNGVPLDVFRPDVRQEARAKMGFKGSTFYLLAGSSSLDNELKGFAFVAEAAQQLAARHPGRFELVTFGRGKPDIVGVPVRHQGYLRNDDALACLYAACDAYVLPSLVDNLPNMLIESIACGTPCVTFNVGGCPDVVRDGLTGFIAHERSGESLVYCIARIIQMSNDVRRGLRLRCREVALAEYGLETMAAAYFKAYSQHFENKVKSEVGFIGCEIACPALDCG